MSFPSVGGDELLKWLEITTTGWRNLLAAHPEALALPCDIRETSSVAGLLQHIVAVELRYAQRLLGMQETPYEDVPCGSGDEIFRVHDAAIRLLDSLRNREARFWSEQIDFVTRKGGTLKKSRYVIFVHLVMHSIRHYAQLATLVRQHGIAPEWPMDYLFVTD